MAKQSKLIGQVLDGKYQLDKQLGQGGMGAVYLATHLGTKRPVALKVIAPQFMANTEFVERFRREAEAAGRLRHPNVVNVTDFGFAQVGRDPVAYLVMEYLDGGSLGDMLKERRRLPLPLVTDILEQICLAVGNAHKLGVIHRDLKPDNIWLQPDGRGGYIAKVLDFGLAKLRDPNELHLADGTQSGTSSSAATQVTNRNTQGLTAGAATTAGQGALTAVAAEQQTAMQAGEGATLIQSDADAPVDGDEGATLIQADVANTAAANEEATRIQPAAADTLEDEGATRIQSFTSGDVDEVHASSASAAQRDSRSSVASSSGLRSTASSRSALNSLTGDTSAGDITRAGAIMGTPLYMSPEQCRSEALDARSDIYSLGVIVYQALAGEAPFKGNMTELMRQHSEDAPPPLQDKCPEVPASVARLVMATLAKNPAERPPTAEAFASAFRATAEGETQILRAAKAHYYTAQRVFFLLSLAIYVPFALLSFATSVTLNRWLVNSAAATLIFYLALYLLLLFATRVSIAACTVALAELRQRSSAAVKLKEIIKAVVHRLPAVAVTVAQQFARVLWGLVRLIVPGARAYINYALAPSVAVTEEVRGEAALTRSKQLIGPLRTIAAALLARDFGIGLSSVLLFPFISVVMAAIFGETVVDAFAAMRVPSLRNFIVIYCWFLLTVMHTVYSAVPIAALYFKARQARGELLDEHGTRDWQAETLKRPGRMSRAAVIWLVAPLAMLAYMMLSSFTRLGAGNNSLIEMVRKGRRQTVAQRLAAGANPNDSRLSTTVLMYAAKDGHVGIVQDLLNAGAKLDAKDNDGDTALMYAAIDGRIDVMRALLNAGANVNAANNHADTSLMAAALRGRTEAVRLLLAAGADVNAKNQNGQTALSLAEAEGHTEVVRLLKDAGAEGGKLD
ncbi:MAG TPA: protein kinase [Blastocatellia bacterium]|nr:protein kinase [Blastocatellia bacterium]